MRTITEIVDAAKANAPATEEELRYALCAMDSLSGFDLADLRTMASLEQDQKPLGAWSRYEESFNRWKRALQKDPKSWLGFNNDPANPEYRRRREMTNKLFARICQKAGE